MKKQWLALATLIIILVTLGLRNRSEGDQSFEHAEEITRVRNIAHQVLLSADDKNSAALPVEVRTNQEYRIRFQKSFSFSADSLVKIVKANLFAYKRYAVLVRDRASNEIVYSFVVSEDSSKTLIPCRQRGLAKGSYDILLRLNPTHSVSYWWSTLILVPLIGGAWVLYKRKKLPTSVPVPDQDSYLPIGQFRFNPSNRRLVMDDDEIELTTKEGELLSILSSSLNTVVDRSRLQKEVWEDQGVLVTRSLDMFISRLRKKLSADPSVRIVNVHGKGYKLETNS